MFASLKPSWMKVDRWLAGWARFRRGRCSQSLPGFDSLDTSWSDSPRKACSGIQGERRQICDESHTNGQGRYLQART